MRVSAPYLPSLATSVVLCACIGAWLRAMPSYEPRVRACVSRVSCRVARCAAVCAAVCAARCVAVSPVSCYMSRVLRVFRVSRVFRRSATKFDITKPIASLAGSHALVPAPSFLIREAML